MFDNVSFKVNNYSIEEFEELVGRIGEPVSVTNDILKCNWYNLRIVYYPNSQILKVINSLHKFYNAAIKGLGGFNHDEFTYTHLAAVISLLEHTIGRPANEMRLLGRFEYGLNIPTDSYRPFKDIIERYQSIVTTATNPFYAHFNSRKKPFGKFCPFTDYTVKCYDKGKQIGLRENILRIEIVHHNVTMTRSILGLKHPTMGDLLNKDNWAKLYKKVKSTYDSIRMLAVPNGDIDEYNKVLYYADAIVNRDLKPQIQNILPQLKKAHDRQRDDPDSPHFLVNKSIPQLFQELINN